MTAAIDLCSDFDGSGLRRVAQANRDGQPIRDFWFSVRSMTAAIGVRRFELAVLVSRS